MRANRFSVVNGLRSLLCVLTLALLLGGPAAAAVSFESLEGLPPGDQYRQLSLLMLITGGTDPALFELLQPVIERQGVDDPLEGHGALLSIRHLEPTSIGGSLEGHAGGFATDSPSAPRI